MRIVVIRPCCIGDVVMATATVAALRHAYPDAHITWAVGGWSRRAIEYHPAIDAILDTGNAALPVKSINGFLRFVQQLRAGKFDLAISLVRSPLMSVAVWLSGIPQRAGLDSNGRGFGYNIRAKIDPTDAQNEAEIYLSVLQAMNIETTGYRINLPVLDTAQARIETLFSERGISKPYLIINPNGGSNPGMLMDSKCWPAENFATVADALAEEFGASVILLGGPNDGVTIENVRKHLKTAAHTFLGELLFPEIGALAAGALVYIGNDTGLTHLAAASGAKTAMILGPSDPKRYAPYTDDSLALWKPIDLNVGGVANSTTSTWDWARDGIQADTALAQIRDFITSAISPTKS